MGNGRRASDDIYGLQSLKAYVDRPWLLRYGVAIASVVLAAFLRYELAHVLDNHARYLSFVAAVAVSAWYGGFLPGILAMVLSGFAVQHLFLQPEEIGSTAGIAALVLFAVVSSVVAWSFERQRLGQKKIIELAEQIDHSKQELQAALEATRQKENEFEIVVDNVAGLIAFVDTQERYLYLNDRYLEHFGEEARDWVGREIRQTVDEDIYEVMRPHIAAALRGEARDFETRAINASGISCEMLVRFTPYVADGRIEGFFSLMTDVSDIREAEAQLRERDERLHLALEAASMAVWEWDPVGETVEVGANYSTVTGLAAPTGNRDEFVAAIHPDDRERVMRETQQAVEQNREFSHEFRLMGADGVQRWLLSRGKLIERDGRKLLVGVLMDVTDRHYAQDALAFLAEASHVLTESLDYEETLSRVASLAVPRIADWCAVDIFEEEGAPRRLAVAHSDPEKLALAQELQERYPTDLNSEHGLGKVMRTGEPELIPHISDEMLRAMARDEEHYRIAADLGLVSAIIVPLRARGKTLGGMTLVTAESGRTYDRADLDLALSLARRCATAVDNSWLYQQAEREIQERIAAERAQAELARQIDNERQRLADILLTVPGVVWEAWGQPDASQQRINFVSEFVEDMLGYTVEEWLEQPNFWLQIVHPEDRERAAREASEIFMGQRPGLSEFRWIAKDGRVLWVEAHSVVVRDEEGQGVGMRGVTIDITVRKRAEEALSKFNEELEQRVQERTKELEEANRELEGFTYSVAHDLRTPLRNIVSSSAMIVRDQANRLDENSKEDLDTLATSAKYMAALIDDLLKFARLGRQDLHVEPVNLSNLAEEIGRYLQEEHGDFKLEVQPGMEAQGDPELLRMMLANLLDNAQKYRHQERPPEVVVGATDRGGERAYFVRDNGIGFDMAFVNKLFQPFQRLHRAEEYPGTGIGLANVRRIVEKHGGRVWAESKPGVGSTFYFTLGQS
jgi:PAS domain S-box-containing protein